MSKLFNFDDIHTIIGQGNYAVVFSSKKYKKRIYRLGKVNNRTNAIQKFLGDDVNIGPCFAKLYTVWKLGKNNPIPERINKQIQKNKNKNDKRKWDQHMRNKHIQWQITLEEYGTLGDLSGNLKNTVLTSNEKNDIMFMLFWSLWSANSQYGFMHRDIKPENIVLKELDEQREFRFLIPETKQLWIIKTNYVPMFIDFDFASLLNTNINNRYMHGSYQITPPEAFAYDLLIKEQHLNNYGNNTFVEEGFDVWSLGITMMNFMLKDAISNLHNSGRFAYNTYNSKSLLPSVLLDWKTTASRFFEDDELWRNISVDEKDKITGQKVVYLGLISIFMKSIGTSMYPPDNLIGKTYSKLIYTKNFKQEIQNMYQHDDQGIKKRYTDLYENKGLSGNQQALFAEIFQWDTKKRVQNGKLYKLFPYMIEQSLKYSPHEFWGIKTYKSTRNTMVLFSFNKNKFFIKNQMNLLNHHKYIDSSICNGCGSNDNLPKNICVCCSKIYCNLKCHQ